MRSLRMVIVAGSVVAAVAPAEAQSRRSRGNQDQQQSGTQAPPKTEEKKFPVGTAWIAVSINGKPFGGTERPAFTMTEQFRVTGFGGCNSFSATGYPLREQGLAIGPIAMTRKSCDKLLMASELAFVTALRTSAKWDTQIGSLVIKGPNGELKFERSL